MATKESTKELIIQFGEKNFVAIVSEEHSVADIRRKLSKNNQIHTLLSSYQCTNEFDITLGGKPLSKEQERITKVRDVLHAQKMLRIVAKKTTKFSPSSSKHGCIHGDGERDSKKRCSQKVGQENLKAEDFRAVHRKEDSPLTIREANRYADAKDLPDSDHAKLGKALK